MYVLANGELTSTASRRHSTAGIIPLRGVATALWYPCSSLIFVFCSVTSSMCVLGWSICHCVVGIVSWEEAQIRCSTQFDAEICENNRKKSCVLRLKFKFCPNRSMRLLTCLTVACAAVAAFSSQASAAKLSSERTIPEMNALAEALESIQPHKVPKRTSIPAHFPLPAPARAIR